jgi:predicted dehydrogenase
LPYTASRCCSLVSPGALRDNKYIDLLVIGTPDHWHALPTIHGCLAGKDVYVEKPCSHNIRESQTMVAAARKHGRMVQVGTQLRSAPFLKEAADLVKSRALGKVIYGRAWETARNRAWRAGRDGPVPPGVDYDLWLGPVSKRPFNAGIFGGGWRWDFAFGTGDLGHDGVHRIDYCRMVMGLDSMPQAIAASGGKFFFEDDQQWPDTLLVNYEYPGQILTYEMRLWSHPKLSWRSRVCARPLRKRRKSLFLG